LVIIPDKQIFIEKAKRGEIFPVYRELPFIPPQQAFERIKGPYSFLLESIKGPEKIARYSFAGFKSFLIFKVKNSTVEWISSERKILTSRTPLTLLKNLLTSYTIKSPSGFPPFVGGAVGIISYDFVHYFERLPRKAHDDLLLPDAHFLLFNTVISFDHKTKKTFIISCPGINEEGFSEPTDGNYSLMYDSACEKISRLYDRLHAKKIGNTEITGSFSRPIELRYEMKRGDYENIVKRTKEYIKAGDIFQANLSQRVSAWIGDTEQWKRPIAGTRPRGQNAKDDMNLRTDLLLNEKERAEHLMLIDLERNDLGKISHYGSVFVDEFMITEDYSHVIHIVSNVKGTPVKNKTCFDAIRAAFPGGTITGVPKVRCMEIIDELEHVTRGPYTGSLGYISFDGTMDLNIIIRTFVIKNGTAYVQAGAGIVADSDPEKEYFETLKKAEALIKTREIL
jgi:anthranilate/para-aminobenzoate synthase component I